MKKLATALMFAPLFALAVEAGKPAPDFSLPGKDGAIKLSDFKGKVVYLDFWASWCGPCKKSFPWMNEMQSKYGSKGLQIIAVNVDQKREDADKFLAATPAQFTVAFHASGSTPKSYEVKGMPSSMLIDAAGNVTYIHAGFKEEQAADVESRIKQSLDKAGK